MNLATVNFSESEEGLFTPTEIRGLMRIEYDRARRYGYGASVMIVGVDRLEYLHDLYGWQSKEEILQGIIRALRGATRNSDFLGVMHSDRIMAVFPHTDERTIVSVATRLLTVCRELDFRSDNRSIRATISIGAATMREDKSLDFEDFVRTAEEALAFAHSSGGDRFVRRETVAEVIGDLREEIEAEAERLADEQRRLGATVAAATLSGDLPVIEDVPASTIADDLRAVFRRHGRTAELVPLEEEVLRVAEDGVEKSRASALSRASAEHSRQIDVLERRVKKLKELLDATESELAGLASQRGVETGIASIYRTVQGLTAEDESFAAKKEMLTLIFEANIDLQKKKKKGS